MSQNELHCIVIDVTSFIAATKMILEGKVSVAFARDTVIWRSSIVQQPFWFFAQN